MSVAVSEEKFELKVIELGNDVVLKLNFILHLNVSPPSFVGTVKRYSPESQSTLANLTSYEDIEEFITLVNNSEVYSEKIKEYIIVAVLDIVNVFGIHSSNRLVEIGN